jgi:hypothetical protein
MSATDHLRQAVGADRIAGTQVGRPDHTPHGNNLALGIDHRIFVAFHYQVTGNRRFERRLIFFFAASQKQ